MKNSSVKVGVVTARFNSEITEKLEEGALSYLEGLNLEVLAVKVPGAVEIPLACKALLDIGCQGIVALGAVIRGETSHYDYVCNSVERGITALMLEYKRPIGFGVLTTENEEQALARAGGAHGNKGQEAAQVVLEMMGLLQELEREGQEVRTERKETKSRTPLAKKTPHKAAKKPGKKAKKK